MRLKILGTKGEIDKSLPKHAKKSGILIDGELLIDVGEKSFLKHALKWILITHFHPDHAYFVRKGQQESPETNAEIYAPEKPLKRIKLLKRKRILGPYTITPIPTHHSKNVISQAYLIEKDGKKILYTGDLVWIDKKYHRLFKHLDLIITEASFIRAGGMVRKDPETGRLYGHNGIPNLLKLLHPFTKTILFVHFGSWFYDDPKASKKKLKALGEELDLQVLTGYDGMSLKI